MKKFIRRTFLIFNLLAVLLLLVAYLAPVVNPRTFVVPSYLGLAFIYIVVLNLLFVIIWIFASKWYFIISLLVLMLGYNVLNRSVPYRTNETKITEPGAFKLMSFNVRVFNRYGWTADGDPDDVARFANNQNPDIICLQEFGVNNRSKTHSEKAVLRLFSRWKYHYFEFGEPGTSGYRQGLAIFSKYKILRTGKLPDGDNDNFTIYADIEKDNKVIRLFTSHLQSINMSGKEYLVYDILKDPTNSEKVRHEMGIFRWHMNAAYKQRAVQAQTYRKYIDASPYPVVVCGDFNDTPVSYAYRKIKGDLIDTYIESGNGIGSTYNGPYPLLRIDYIFIDKRLTSNDFKRYKVDLSDHYPISCYIAFKE
ncbi:endonuclease/exonuclease/phosphatase family protein [Saccharicrinis sp. FJH62]|uniref:endonuclease/exonuclease/phosphatase family protein n=1 Tax=Saccharicrinis sp. FJH62 TaxID=3344657 RepID=UPI0035D4E573